MSEDISIVRGKRFFNSSFYNNILSTNIALYKYMADIFFEGNMERVVWASIDLMFRKRQEQLAARKAYNSPDPDLGLLDLPFCAFRLTQDGVQSGNKRNWWNPTLHAKGMWFEDLERKLRITPVTLNYEACFCCNHDSDLFMMQQNMIETANAETVLESFVDTIAEDGSTHSLKNIIIYDVTPKMNTTFTEKDWLEKNKIQTISLDISCQTWLIIEDYNHRYSVTKKVIFNFLHGANYYNAIQGKANIDSAAREAVWGVFMEDNVGDPFIFSEEDLYENEDKDK